ncbi:uroporphyrinogen-III synthase [Chryseomicrobium palamuruense]|uniref:Uroporphyrinogen-III synthase n=1 Tax=Chryseomicrobium palamuruense TaxID=682973 RepID=A0ABV8UZ08_9BACL
MSNFILTNQLHDPEFLEKIEASGFRAVHYPLIETEPVKMTKEGISQLLACDWLLFTSQTAVHAFFQQVTQPLWHQFAVVGTKTATALKEYGYSASFIPSTFSADRFVEEWNAVQPSGSRVGFCKGNLAKPTIEEGLDALVTAVVVYKTTDRPEHIEAINKLCLNEPESTLVFASPSGVKVFQEAGGKIAPDTIVCAIGHVTKQALEEAGLPVHVMPERYTLEDVLLERLQYKE